MLYPLSYRRNNLRFCGSDMLGCITLTSVLTPETQNRRENATSKSTKKVSIKKPFIPGDLQSPGFCGSGVLPAVINAGETPATQFQQRQVSDFTDVLPIIPVITTVSVGGIMPIIAIVGFRFRSLNPL